MRNRRALGLFVLLLGISFSAHAQATRTWVSGVGDDVNPCSRTAPCKTFAGAISKTATNGEISVLDPGGFGAVTITKSITLEGADFTAGILASGVQGIIVNALSTDVVKIHKIVISGAGTGTNGVVILNAKSVAIENCAIFGFANRGVRIANSNPGAKVSISNTSIRDNGGAGVASEPTGGGSVLLSIDNSRITGTTGNGLNGEGSGVLLVNSTSADIVNSVISQSANAGLFVRNASVEVNVANTAIFRNTTGVAVGDQGGGTVRLFGSQVVTNSNGLVITAGAINSHGNNAIKGNGGNETPSLPLINTQ